MPDTRHLVERQISKPGTGINKDIVINQERGRTKICSNSTRPAQNFYLHTFIV
jgi:hypothetical protein